MAACPGGASLYELQREQQIAANKAKLKELVPERLTLDTAHQVKRAVPKIARTIPVDDACIRRNPGRHARPAADALKDGRAAPAAPTRDSDDDAEYTGGEDEDEEDGPPRGRKRGRGGAAAKPARVKTGRASRVRLPPADGGAGRRTTEGLSAQPGAWHPCLYGASQGAQETAFECAVQAQARLASKGVHCSEVRVMSTSQVEKGYWLALPKEWMSPLKHLHDRRVQLVCTNKWPAGCWYRRTGPAGAGKSGAAQHFTAVQAEPAERQQQLQGAVWEPVWESVVKVHDSGAGALSGGWRGFAIDHDLTLNDCIFFELESDTRWRVHIMRAGDYEEQPDGAAITTRTPNQPAFFGTHFTPEDTAADAPTADTKRAPVKKGTAPLAAVA